MLDEEGFVGGVDGREIVSGLSRIRSFHVALLQASGYDSFNVL